MSNGVFNFNFLVFVFSEILWGPKFTLGALRPLVATYRRIFFLPKASTSQYLFFFNFNILALVVSEILEGFKFMIWAPYPPVRPLVGNFCIRGEYFTMSNGVLNFNFLALVCSKILGGSQIIYTRGPYVPWTPHSGEIFLPKASTSQYLIVFLISTF